MVSGGRAMLQNVLVIGDYQNFKYHVFNNMDLAIQDILKDIFAVHCTEDYEELIKDNIHQYGLVISYADRWNEPLTDDQASGLLNYINGGGNFLIIHNGISLQAREDVRAMIGASFVGHPPYCRLNMQIKAKDHPLMKGLKDFSITDEPYRFEFSPQLETEILLGYEFDGCYYPAGWTHQYGSGRVVYLMPGHDGSTFLNEDYRTMIRQVCIRLGQNDA